MDNLQIGEQVEVIDKTSCHNMPIGCIVTIKDIKQINNNIKQIYIAESTNWLYPADIKQLYKPTIKKGKFIITDPSYIMNKQQYKEIIENYKQYIEPNYKNIQFPINSTYITYNTTKKPITIHYIETTPYGPGMCKHEKQSIKNNSGLLCIAENKLEWLDEKYGATFETLSEAKNNFQDILKKI